MSVLLVNHDNYHECKLDSGEIVEFDAAADEFYPTLYKETLKPLGRGIRLDSESKIFEYFFIRKNKPYPKGLLKLEENKSLKKEIKKLVRRNKNLKEELRVIYNYVLQ